MALTLNITSYDGQAFNHIPPFTLNENESRATVGRHDKNNWVLPDTENHISGQHAIIADETSHFSITDTSTNGVFINHSETPLGYGHSAPLSHGDKLSIGKYEIDVEISNAQENPFSSATPLDDELFMGLDSNPIGHLINNDMPQTDWEEKAPKKNTADIKLERKQNQPRSNSDLILGDAFTPPSGLFDISNTPEEKNIPHTGTPFPENWLEQENDNANLNAKEKTSEPKSAASKPSIEEFTPQPRVAPSPAPPSIKPTTEKPAESAPEQNDLVCALLQGMELENSDSIRTFDAETFRAIGKILRTAVAGTREVLMARAQLKNEMRLDVTILRPVENNPVKLSFSTGEALERLFAAPDKGFMDPHDAIKESFDDIKSHQIAMLAGMQTAFKEVLLRFDPDTLQKRLQKQNPISASIPIQKQAKLWRSFETLYSEIEAEAKDDFNTLFGQAFSKAYEEQERKLKAKRVT